MMKNKLEYMGKILAALVPQILPIILKRALKITLKRNQLFGGDDLLFKTGVRNSIVYGEYGCGESTKWALMNTNALIISIDTSREWVLKISDENKSFNHRLSLYHANLGDVGIWGYPVSYEFINDFSQYTDFIWKQDKKPDFVLIDGRFRVCCFLTCLKYATEGTEIIFDDYINNEKYHFIEKYVRRSEEYGRQCKFVVPNKDDININDLEVDIESFRLVMD